MLNHAAWTEHENADIRYKHSKDKEGRESHAPLDPTIDEFGCPLSEMSGAKLNAYLADWSQFG